MNASNGASGQKWTLFLVVAALVSISSFLFFAEGLSPFGAANSPCQPLLGASATLRSQLSETTFGAVTKFKLPSPVRSPNAITVAPDGSVWFGEQAIPGVGHLFSNGTLIEYAWPHSASYTTEDSCATRSYTWGIALWNGKVWASDVTGNQLLGLDPKTGSAESVKLTTNDSFPYSLSVGPDGALWFTELYSSVIGRLSPGGNLTVHHIQYEGVDEVPTQIAFANSSLGYFVDTGGGAEGGPPAIFTFNPGSFSPRAVALNHTLYSPDSIALADGGFWLAQHGASSVIFHDPIGKAWTTYPTSTETYIDTTLPYFVAADGSYVWFNEHYGNKIARLDFTKQTLTEYSEADPPVSNASLIDNALTFAVGMNGVWFTEWTANYIGFVDIAFKPSFSVDTQNSTLEAPPGGETSLVLSVTGRSSAPLSLKFSDSESPSSIPQNISMVPSIDTIASLNGVTNVRVDVKLSAATHSGDYTLLMTVSDGLVLQSKYVKLRVP